MNVRNYTAQLVRNFVSKVGIVNFVVLEWGPIGKLRRSKRLFEGKSNKAFLYFLLNFSHGW